MSIVRGIFRLFALCLMVAFGMTAGLLVSLMLPRKAYLWLARHWHGWVIFALGIRLCRQGKTPDGTVFVVSNHVSWLDICVIGSSLPVVFLSKMEVKSWPILGWLVQSAGTLFIDRGQGAGAAQQALSTALSHQQSTMLFPEARTGDGTVLGRFFPRLFQAAVESAAPVLPVSIRYLDQQHCPTSLPGYTGQVSFLQSLWRTACARGLQVQLKIGQIIPPSQNRDSLSDLARAQIAELLDANSL